MDNIAPNLGHSIPATILSYENNNKQTTTPESVVFKFQGLVCFDQRNFQKPNWSFQITNNFASHT